MDIQNLEDKNILEEFINKLVTVLIKHYDIENCNNQIFIKDQNNRIGDGLSKQYSLYFSNLGRVFVEFKLSSPETDIESLLEISIYDTIINKIEDFQDDLYELSSYDFNSLQNTNVLVSYCDNILRSKLDSITGNSFELLNRLSRTNYEKTECLGTIVINDCKENIIAEIEENGSMLFCCNNSIRIRKLLQVTNENISLAVQVYSALNNTNQNIMIGFSDSKATNSMKIKFEGKNHLSFWKGSIKLFEYKSGKFNKNFKKVNMQLPSESKEYLDVIDENLFDKLNIFITKSKKKYKFSWCFVYFYR